MMNRLYISPEGSDENSGENDSPLRTVESALKKSDSTHTELVLFSGTHYLEDTIVLGHANSGLTLRSAEGENVMLSGAIPVTSSWEVHKGPVMVCSFSADRIGDQLFVNGKRQTRARFPKKNEGNGGYAGGITGGQWPHKELKFDKSSFSPRKWKDPSQGILHIFPNSFWGNLQWKIDSIHYERETIFLGKGGYQINDVMQGKDATGIGPRSKWFIENIFEELDAPGEWYYDKTSEKLYLYPESGIDPNEALVEFSRLKELIRLEGTQENPVINVTISGLRFAHTSTTFLDPYDAPSLGDWTICRKGAVYLEGTEGCRITGCFFDQNGGNSLFFNRYNRDSLVDNCLICGSGDSGICLVGDLYHTLGSQRPFPSDIRIENNRLYRLGEYGKQTAAVFVSVAQRITISHNTMHTLPRAAVCINDGTWGGHLIEYNDIYDTVRETGDHGPFNSWGRGRFWCLNQSHGPASHIAGNVLLDCREPMVINQNRFRDNRGWGIDLDDGTSNTVVSNNLCIGISVKLREGDYRTVTNNIFYKGANPPGFHLGYEKNSDKFLRNIIVTDRRSVNPEEDVDFKMDKGDGHIYKIIFPPSRGEWFAQWDRNLFFNDMGEFKAQARLRSGETLEFSLEDWQARGYDLNSLYGDPRFKNPEKGDFRLHPISPALTLGFKPLDYDHFGTVAYANIWEEYISES